MTKKYNLILSKINKGVDRGWSGEYLVGYVKDMDGDAYLSDKLYAEKLHQPYAKFTQDDIDKLKASLPTKGMRAVVDASKVEVKEPLYYMQSKRSRTDARRLFYWFHDKKSWLDDLSCYQAKSIHDEPFKSGTDYFRRNFLRPKSDWEPYLKPDRELVRYDPEEDVDD